MKIFYFFLLIFPLYSSAQEYLDRKITVNYVDTSGLYERVRLRFVKEGYIVMDDRNPDTLTTYPKDNAPLGSMYIKAAISGDKVTFWGYYSKKKFVGLGHSFTPKNYQPVIFYGRKEGIGWRELKRFAKTLGGDFDYSK